MGLNWIHWSANEITLESRMKIESKSRELSTFFELKSSMKFHYEWQLDEVYWIQQVNSQEAQSGIFSIHDSGAFNSLFFRFQIEQVTHLKLDQHLISWIFSISGSHEFHKFLWISEFKSLIQSELQILKLRFLTSLSSVWFISFDLEAPKSLEQFGLAPF